MGTRGLCPCDLRTLCVSWVFGPTLVTGMSTVLRHSTLAEPLPLPFVLSRKVQRAATLGIFWVTWQPLKTRIPGA